MTDIAELGISVESRSAVLAVTELDKLVSASGRAEKAVDNLGKSSIETSTEMQKMVNSFAGVKDEMSDAAASAQVFESALDEQRASFEALRMSIDPVYAASMRYADVIDQIAIAQQLGVISAREADAAFRAAETRFLGVGSGLDDVTVATRNSGHEMKMLGFQLSQIVQQGTATGQWATAFAIQAADIGASFGVVGLAIGTLTTLALPALVNWLSSGSEEAGTLEDAIGDLVSGLDQYQTFIEQAAQSTATLTEEFGEFAEQIRGFSEFMSEVTLDKAFSDLETKLDPLKMGLGEVQEAFRQLVEQEQFLASIDREQYPVEWQNAADSVDIFRVALEDAAATFELLPGEALALANALDEVGRAEGPEQMAQATTRALAIFERIRERTGQLTDDLADAALNTRKLQEEAAKASKATTDSYLAAETLEQRMIAAYAQYALTRGMATELANETERAAGAAAALARYNAELSNTGQSSGPDAARTRVQFGGGAFAPPVTGAGLAYEPPEGSGGGGGGGGDDYASRLESLMEGLRTEREIEEEWYQETLSILEDRRAMELLTEEQHKEAMIALEEEYQSRLQAIEMEARQRKLSDTANLFGALADIASVGGKKTAKAVAAFQAIEGTINAYGAAIKALNTPGITLAGRFAAYASVLAAGLRGVMAIKSAGGAVGGGGGGGASTLSSAAAQGSVAEQTTTVRNVVFGIRPEDIFTGKQIYEMFVEESKLRGTTSFELIGG